MLAGRFLFLFPSKNNTCQLMPLHQPSKPNTESLGNPHVQLLQDAPVESTPGDHLRGQAIRCGVDLGVSLILRMGFLWVSRVFSGFRRVSYGFSCFLRISQGFLWFLVFSHDFPWFPHGFPMISHDLPWSPNGFLWLPYGFPIWVMTRVPVRNPKVLPD